MRAAFQSLHAFRTSSRRSAWLVTGAAFTAEGASPTTSSAPVPSCSGSFSPRRFSRRGRPAAARNIAEHGRLAESIVRRPGLLDDAGAVAERDFCAGPAFDGGG